MISIVLTFKNSAFSNSEYYEYHKLTNEFVRLHGIENTNLLFDAHDKSKVIGRHFVFKNEEDATFFKLKWL